MRGARVLHGMASGSCLRAYGARGRQRKIIHATRAVASAAASGTRHRRALC
ncbi:hypothetical protein BURPS1710b_A1498 [Burkholderia pseudomallei 1710b]|uniref:Uncharacterized protein n=2 Tax=Burkholderia pseudomallei TaxID=28450 RepID=Q3JIE8_BURP1|nr:hypothetical protein BURPS1710b_A1498 [Burkholderia pseudomallei 1710b]